MVHLRIHLRACLHSLLSLPESLVEIVLLASPGQHPSVRHSIRSVLSENEHHDVEFSIVHWPEGVNQSVAVLQAGQRAMTEWVLLDDESAHHNQCGGDVDGGDEGGFSQIFILSEMAHRIKVDLELDELPRLCDYFDMIGGVGMGG